MLLVGTDKSADRVENNSTGGVYRTDSIILARVDPLAAKLTLVSIQRDTLVDLGGDYGQQKINATYTYGARRCSSRRCQSSQTCPSLTMPR